MFATVDQLLETAKKNLVKSWAHVFYQKFFYRIDKTIFPLLYSENYSRPDVPINILEKGKFLLFVLLQGYVCWFRRRELRNYGIRGKYSTLKIF